MLDREDLLEHVEWLLREGEFTKAWTLCRRGLRRFPEDAQLWFLMGDSLLDSGRYMQADKAFKSASQLRAEWAAPVAKRAEINLLLGREKRARQLIEQAYQMDRDLPHISFVKAVCSELEGRDDIAHFWYRRAQKLDPELYHLPRQLSFDEFMKEFSVALEHLRSTDYAKLVLTDTRWLVLTSVDHDIPELKEVSPLAFCHLIPATVAQASTGNAKGAQERDADRASAPAPIQLGFVFQKNIQRVCRNSDEVYTQIYVALLDELDALNGNEPADY